MRPRLRREIPLTLGVAALLLFSFLTGPPSQTASRSPPVANRLLPLMGGPLGALAGASPNYDEQIGLTFTDTFTTLQYNVTAVAQTNADGYGPAYLLNGLTDVGYWYQVGLSWNWNPGTVPGTGFSMSYEVFDSGGHSVFPTTGGGGLLSYSGSVNQGDTVELFLSFSAGTVVMSSRDLNTRATGSISFSDEGGSEFVGLVQEANSNGFFTGLMTEEYHSSPYYGNELGVNYSSATPLTNGFLWADEFEVAPNTVLFSGSKFVSFLNTGIIQSFSENGTTELADAHSLVTGEFNEIPLTLSYTVVGGGSGYAPPVLIYVYKGVQRNASLPDTKTTFLADVGSAWHVSATLPGSSPSERWEALQPLAGNITAPVTEGLYYFHQFIFRFGYSVVGGGSGYGPPGINVTSFGDSFFWAGSQATWLDAGTTFAYPTELPGSTSGERWVAGSLPPGLVSRAQDVEVRYFHQFTLTTNYTVLGGGSPQAPLLEATSLGSPESLPLGNTTYFIDASSFWSVPNIIQGNSAGERWVAPGATNGTATAPETVDLPYQHQYTFFVGVSPATGGTVTAPSQWQDAGVTIVISQSANAGWRFAGWNGSGSGSYSGASNSSSVVVGAPMTENATFYPGLVIASGSNGAVSYRYGSQAGQVSAGKSTVVYVPQGTSFALQATPSSFLYRFEGWSGANNGTGQEALVVLDSPVTVTAGFSLDTIALGGILAILVVAAALVTFAVLRHRRRAIDIKTPTPP